MVAFSPPARFAGGDSNFTLWLRKNCLSCVRAGSPSARVISQPAPWFVLKKGLRMSSKRLVLPLLLALAAAGLPSHAGTSMPAVTSQPLKAAIQRGLHKLFPFRESDEPFEAAAQGHMSAQEQAHLMAGADEDFFHEMDYGITKNPEALRKTLDAYIPGITAAEAVRRTARGRDNWIAWTGGNDRFWNYMTQATFGSLDFLKTISNHDSLPATRDNRWKQLGLVNEPCFEKSGPRADRWGLWLDKHAAGCQPDPFENKAKYKGVMTGWRGKTAQVKGKAVTFDEGSFYGYATGVIGLRLFPNPDFGPEQAATWDANRYYTDPAYYNDPKLVRPYRVGMSCAFCHVGPNPSRPPADFEHPKWENLNANAGAQHFWVDRIFVWDHKRSQDSFVYQLLHTSRPGSLDTSLISSDQINNPRTMNAVYDLPARVTLAAKMGHGEQLSGDETRNAQFSALDQRVVPASSHLRGLYDPSNHNILSPRILKDGSDSVGALGALNRVYINIGLFSEEWVQNFIPLVGGSHLTPFRIEVAEKKSLYWRATVNQTPDLALFFLAATRPDKLSEAPGVPAGYLKEMTHPQIKLGQKVFAETCAKCHSSKLPEKAYTFFKGPKGYCNGKNYLDCWNKYWDYTKSPEFKQQMDALVLQPDFLKDNFLSTELRIPVTLLDGQLCSPIATNAIKGNIWDNFSSSTYKALPGVGKFKVNYPPVTGTKMLSEDQAVPAGGRGYLRPASLISLWATAPYLGNNSLGKFDESGTVRGRLGSFEDSIHKLLDPSLRGHDAPPGQQVVTYTSRSGAQLPGVMDVLTHDSYLKIPKGYLPTKLLKKFLDHGAKEMVKSGNCAPAAGAAPSADGYEASYSDCERNDFLMLGPIPAGVPVNLIANIDLGSNLGKIEGFAHDLKLGKAVGALVEAVLQIRKGKLTGEAARQAFMAKASGPLLSVSKCKDFVVNRGHYFGTGYAPDKGDATLTPEEKAALVEYLKHM